MTGFTRRTAIVLPASLRLLIRHTRFATLAILSLGVAIALNTTMYSVLDALMNPTLELRDPDRLYEIRFYGDYRQRLPVHERNEAYASLTTVEAVAGLRWAYRDRMVERGDRVREVNVATVTPNYFAVIGSRPFVGRVFFASDLDASPRPVVLSERLWNQLFPENQEFEPGTLIVGDQPRVVIGLLRRNADLPGLSTDVWQLPTPAELPTMLNYIARVRPGVTVEQLRAELLGLTKRFAQTTGEGESPDIGFNARSLVHFPFEVGDFAWALIGSVIAVLLVACANLANLQLARGVARARELATRAAVGATRRQIIAQLTAESAWLAGAGLALGAVLTWWGMHLVEAYAPPMYGSFELQAQISWRVMLFAVFVTLFCLALVGLAPAARLSSVNLNEVLKSGAGTGRSRSMRRQYGVLVVVEIALALALLSSAALLMSMAAEVRSVDVAYDPRGLLSTIVGVAPGGPGDRRTRGDWSEILVQRALTVPGVTHAATVTAGSPATDAVSIDDPGGAPVTYPMPQWSYRIVSPDYFRTVRTPILRGRGFSPGEFAEPQVVVDQETAGCLWPGADPIGRLIKLDSAHAPGSWLRVVGVTSRLRTWEVYSGDRIVRGPGCPTPKRLGQVYVLNAGDTATIPPPESSWRRLGTARLEIVLRAEGDPSRVGVLLRRAVTRLSGVSFVNYPEPWGDIKELASLRARQDFVAVLFAVFAMVAAALAALGVYSIVSFSVAQRTREFGVRMTLGAGAREIRELVAREGNVLTLLGIVAGLLITWKSAGLLRDFLFSDWDRYDARMFAIAAAILFAAAWLASWIPARRAARINPVEALRND